MKNAISRIAISAFVVAVFCLSATSAQAQQNNDVPKVEIGPFFTLNTDFSDAALGVGGRMTFNPHRIFGLDLEFSYYPKQSASEDFFGISAEGTVLTGFFGPKLTYRMGDQASVFGKVRPGFLWVSGDVTIPRQGTIHVTESQFAFDAGGGVEVFASKKVGFRFDGAAVFVPNGGTSFVFTGGVMFRF